MDWRMWRWLVMLVLGAVVIFNLGIANAIFHWNLQTVAFDIATVQTIIGFAAAIAFWVQWKKV